MSRPPQVAGGSRRPRRQDTAWRILVGLQATVLLLIVASLLIVLLTGLFGSLFAQHTP
ncbi:MAG: hypothetical protein ACRENL_05010 [Candidatus Dormibacteria bacterium]